MFQRERGMRWLEQNSAKRRVFRGENWAKTFRPTISSQSIDGPKHAFDGIFHKGYICA
jgi:hypothetical protein